MCVCGAGGGLARRGSARSNARRASAPACQWGLAYHPTTRACLRVCTRACLVWYRRGEALSPASLPSVGDRVRYCYDCSYFVRRYSAYVSGLISQM